jgi:hypothetical protein
VTAACRAVPGATAASSVTFCWYSAD